eukprot:CAMPEP_0176345012 /NCGR_PEP_ID=MMETSP0126-20121128/5138_1 /TAXON_ID=141414 ORGANISM="Strombidinopsis acuminatum, Strain SPMC142" /NCGR_SAMPLE_ID=MMETSP0126 /ASSEMBLY_ACC=CAM_ASM_000229 /LENGTH=43 /DNA_ID= /DNA_START= /DNA_END= /DNA_ORIENTATION=
MNAHEYFDIEPIVIKHAEGHKFPRAIEDEDYFKLKEFVKERFL